MKKVLIALLVAISLAACGNDKEGIPSESQKETNQTTQQSQATTNTDDNSASKDGSSQTGKADNTPTFSGDVIEFFGLGWDDALKLLGNGSTIITSRSISNDKNGVEVSLTNSADNLKVYLVDRVRIQSNSDVSFHGMRVGDSLKETDKLLMDGGASYSGELSWTTEIEKETYTIKCYTDDDKTIASMEVFESMTSMADIKKLSEKLNSYDQGAYEQDMHEFEPIYWE